MFTAEGLYDYSLNKTMMYLIQESSDSICFCWGISGVFIIFTGSSIEPGYIPLIMHALTGSGSKAEAENNSKKTDSLNPSVTLNYALVELNIQSINNF